MTIIYKGKSYNSVKELLADVEVNFNIPQGKKAEYASKNYVIIVTKDKIEKAKELHKKGIAKGQISKSLSIPYEKVIQIVTYGWCQNMENPPELTCKRCGKKYYGAPWSEYCADCAKLNYEESPTAKSLKANGYCPLKYDDYW